MKKLSLLFLTILYTTLLQAQDSATSKFSFNHLALSVKDVNRSAEFYKTVLKLKEINNRTKIEGIRWFDFGDRKELHLISILKEEVKQNKAVHIGIATADFDAFVKNLDALKILYSDWLGIPQSITNRADGIKQVYFQDPDKNWIEVNSEQ